MSINTFFTKLVPKEKKFYPMFEQQAELIVRAAQMQIEVLEQLNPVKEKDLLKGIMKLEEEGDELSQNLFDILDQTFVTPFDREDIFQLTQSLDRVLDLIKSVSQRIRMYRPKDFPEDCLVMARLVLTGAEQIQTAVAELKSLKKTEKILKAVKKIKKIEAEADDLYHTAISQIFKNEKDAIELIKKKEIIEQLEQTTDRLQAVSHVLKTIMLKNA